MNMERSMRSTIMSCNFPRHYKKTSVLTRIYGQGGLSRSRCAPTSAMSVRFPDRLIVHPSKGLLHSAHWASPVLCQTQFEHMALNYFSWGPVHFLFVCLFQVQFSLLSTCDKVDCMLNAGWFFFFLIMTPFLTRCFKYPMDSCILQIASFSYKHFQCGP